MRGLIISFLLFSGFLFAQGPQPEKYALVIGVKTYQHVPPLANSLNDAKDMSAVLKKKGFSVIELYDPSTKRIMQDAVKRYFELLRNAPGAAGLVYYSGHGMQVKGVNYLVPTQANPQMEADLEDQCVKLDYLMTALQEAGNTLNIFILDACRNNPFRGFTRSGERGLSMVDAPKGSYIVYATKPGSVASDGTGRNGLFTSKLLQHLNTAGLNIEQVFKQVAKDVAVASNDEQRPWIASDFTGDFYFTPGATVQQSATVSATSESTSGNKVAAVRGNIDIPPASTAGLDFGYGAGETPAVAIGNQVWATKNLNVDRFANGDVIPEVKGYKEWKAAGKAGKPAWCYFDNDSFHGAKSGKLYNWFAVIDRRGVCPTGWQIPTDEDWKEYTEQSAIAGSGIESGSFSVVLAGRRGVDGTFQSRGSIGNFWSSIETEPYSEFAYIWSFTESDPILRKVQNFKVNGNSIRCIKSKAEPVVTSFDSTEKGEESVTAKIARPDFGYGQGNTSIMEKGNRFWSEMNLNLGRFANGDIIPEARNEQDWRTAGNTGKPAWCYYKNTTSFGTRYGRLYNWYAVADPRGLCPAGWHIPSDEEWNVFGADSNQLKNFSGLPAIVGGLRLLDGTFNGLGMDSYWWSSTSVDTGGARGFGWSKVSPSVSEAFEKKAGLSVRCVRD